MGRRGGRQESRYTPGRPISLGDIASSYPEEILDIKVEKQGRQGQRVRWLQNKLSERITLRGRALARSIKVAHRSQYVFEARSGCMVKNPLLAG
jgi:hypothetical protein